MLRVLLVQPPHRDTFGYSMPPLGPLHLGAAARDAGHAVRFLDLALRVRRGDLPADDTLIEACADAIVGAAVGGGPPDVLGLGAMISSMPAALHLAAAVKARRPELPVILGGQGPETVEEAVIARYGQVDAVAVGEAEATFVEWLAALDADGPRRDGATTRAGDGRAAGPDLLARSGACDVPGLVVRRDGLPHRTPPRAPVADLDHVPPPAWDLAESPRAYAKAAGADESLFPIDLGRGCTYACSFCTTPVFWGRAARQLSPARAADAFDRLADLDGLDCAYVTHDLFTVDRERVLAICAEKVRRGNTLPWECRTRLDLVDRELLEAMRAAGCRRILYGVESDRPDVLEHVHKGGRATTLDVRAALREASAAGMASILGLMCGVPGETREDVEANLRLAADAAVIDGVSLSLHWFNVTPGNGRAAEVGDDLRLVPGLSADLVRGHDLPAGHVHPEQARLIADDPEVFAAFRVTGSPGATPASLHRLTRNAHLLLEVLPRTARCLARHRGLGLRELLDGFLARHDPTADEAGGDEAWLCDDAPAPRAVDPALWAEPHVLDRRLGAATLACEVAACGDPRVVALAQYELALFETTARQVLRFDVDPLPLVRALDSGEPLPSAGGPRAVLFARRGEVVRAVALSDFLADAAEEPDDERVLAAWPTADASHLTRAREHLRELSGPAGDGAAP